MRAVGRLFQLLEDVSLVNAREEDFVTSGTQDIPAIVPFRARSVYANNLDGTSTLYIYRGALGKVGTPLCSVPAGQEKTVQFGQSRDTFWLSGGPAVVTFSSGLFNAEPTGITLKGSLAPLPSTGEIALVSTMAAQAGDVSIPASASYTATQALHVLGQRMCVAIASVVGANATISADAAGLSNANMLPSGASAPAAIASTTTTYTWAPNYDPYEVIVYNASSTTAITLKNCSVLCH